MTTYRLTCYLTVANQFWEREVTFPCFPYPSLGVGSFTVVSVNVCQGDLDGAGSIDVTLEGDFEGEEAATRSILESQGWRRRL